MCTRYTRAIDDMTAGIAPVGTAIPEQYLRHTAFFNMANRSDRSKRVVIRRDWATGGKGVVFKFRPTINRRVIVVGDMTTGDSGGSAYQSIVDRYRVVRKPFPWLPFFEFFRQGAGAGTSYYNVYTGVPFYGMAVAMKPMSCTDGSFPEFDVKVSFDIEYRKPIDYTANSVADVAARSYLLYADTSGSGVV